jgi:hypothetical protein
MPRLSDPWLEACIARSGVAEFFPGPVLDTGGELMRRTCGGSQVNRDCPILVWTGTIRFRPRRCACWPRSLAFQLSLSSGHLALGMSCRSLMRFCLSTSHGIKGSRSCDRGIGPEIEPDDKLAASRLFADSFAMCVPFVRGIDYPNSWTSGYVSGLSSAN